jgi:protein TonB
VGRHRLVRGRLRSSVERAKLEVPPTIDVQTNLKMASALPDIGMVNAPTVGMSMGNGDGSGIGSGHGRGMGPGAGGNTGGGVIQVGGSVSAPVEIYKVEPEFSDEARRAKLSGNVLVNLWVDQSGRATHVRVLQGLGMGLDEKAIDAVRQFRFKPAMENGKPVTVELNIEVGFHIY